MRNAVKLFICLFVVLMISSCAGGEKPAETTTEGQVTETTTNAKDLILEEKGEYYELLRTEDFEYVFRIYDVNHELVDADEFPNHSNVQITTPSPHTVKIRMSAGPGTTLTSTRYYNAEKDALSRWFYSVYDESDDLVIYSDRTKLVIRNIFDKTIYYHEIAEFGNPVSEATVEPFRSAKFINDGKSIEVTYWTGDWHGDRDDFRDVTEIIKL